MRTRVLNGEALGGTKLKSGNTVTEPGLSGREMMRKKAITDDLTMDVWVDGGLPEKI